MPERTLHRAFHEHFGIGPNRCLWRRRMHLARRALQLARPTSASVTSIAMDHGFWELGWFAAAYRQLFGETPSATLRRPPDSGPPLQPSGLLDLPVPPSPVAASARHAAGDAVLRHVIGWSRRAEQGATARPQRSSPAVGQFLQGNP
ncbi:helix-turn-helix domain-containing protein [Xanthobacter autotrophicus]|uniref:helix-turn-helix domain-containing protein n=1 Tax=Xanthobacter autotrophicus TaxID=280 RepID=UPI00372D31B6